MVATPWAVLLCRFNDDTSQPIYPRQRFNEIFTAAGNGKFNMVDYFRDMSHGRLELSGSQVFPPQDGWYTVAHPSTDYLSWNTPTHGRGALLVWAREAATAAGHDLSGFHNIVVVMNTPTDLYGSTSGVATDDGRNPDNGMTSLSPSMLGQEMAHGYDLNHARIEGSTADYMDPFDIMSTAGAFMGAHPVYTERDARGNPIFLIGPGLNAATMHAFGWLDPSRVWSPGAGGLNLSVQLRPLHRMDLPGYLCARIGDYFLEFRMNELWDAGLPEPVVLIHDFFDGHSYLQVVDGGNGFLTQGDSFSSGDVSNQPAPLHGAGLQITLTDIDPANCTATLHIRRWLDERPQAGPGTILGGVANDGGGWIIVGGKMVKVPPRSPLYAMLEKMAEVQITEELSISQARSIVKAEAYSAIADMAGRQATLGRAVRTPRVEVLNRVERRR